MKIASGWFGAVFVSLAVSVAAQTGIDRLTGGSAARDAQARGGRTTQKGGSWVVPRTKWGHPDLEGIWTNFDRTPFERRDPARTPARTNTAEAAVGPAPEWLSQDYSYSR